MSQFDIIAIMELICGRQHFFFHKLIFEKRVTSKLQSQSNFQ